MKLRGPDNWRADLITPSLSEVDTSVLAAIYKSRGIKRIWHDLDRTLAGHHDERLSNDILRYLAEMSSHGFKIGILSNAERKRTPRVHDMSRQGSQYIGSKIDVATSFMAGAGKPDTAIYDYVTKKYGESPEETAACGDLVGRDVLGGKRAGLGFVVLTEPYGEGGHWMVEALQRPIESNIVFRRWLGAPLMPSNTDAIFSAVELPEEAAA